MRKAWYSCRLTHLQYPQAHNFNTSTATHTHAKAGALDHKSKDDVEGRIIMCEAMRADNGPESHRFSNNSLIQWHTFSTPVSHYTHNVPRDSRAIRKNERTFGRLRASRLLNYRTRLFPALHTRARATFDEGFHSCRR